MAKFITQMRRGTYQDWISSGVIPRAGELVVEIDETNNLHKLKIGDGTTDYENLAYLMAGAIMGVKVDGTELTKDSNGNIDITGKENKGKITLNNTEQTVVTHTLSITDNGTTTTYTLLGV